MRFLHLIRPVMFMLPEVASPDRKVSEILIGEQSQTLTISMIALFYYSLP